MKYCFLSSLPVDECAKRLAQYLADHPLHFFSRRPLTLVGKIDGYQFTLRTSSHSNSNSFHGTLHPHQEGTLIDGDFSMHWAPKVVGGGILGCGVVGACVLSGAVVLGVIGMLVISDAPVQLGEDLSSILGLVIAVGLFLPLGSMVAALIMLLATVASKKIWESTDIPRITAFMEERLRARCVEQDEVLELC